MLFLRAFSLWSLIVFPIFSCQAAVAPLVNTMNVLDTYTWRISDGWSNGGMFQVGWRADHIDIYSQMLRLRLDDSPCISNAALCSGQTYAAAEYSSVDLMPMGQVDFYAQAARANGVITGLFLYTGASDANPHDEIDIEFLGKDTTQVQFNYFVQGVGGHEALVPLGFDAALGVHHYTIRWQQNAIVWLVDGIEKHRVSGAILPSSPMRIFTNIWAAKGVDIWSGAFVYPNMPLYAYVDSIYYVPKPANGSITTTNQGSVNQINQQAGSGGGCMAVQPWSMLIGLCMMLVLVYQGRRLL